MNLLKDMELFIKVVHCNGLAAAGRELGITAASVTTRIKNLESHYQVKLLTRTTRNIKLTVQGNEFYSDCLKLIGDVDEIENKLKSRQKNIAGALRVSATSDLGRQHIAPLLNEFVKMHPDVQPSLNLRDSVADFSDNDLDLAVRYGVASDDMLIASKLVESRRVLCASPDYLKRNGVPVSVSDLEHHSCLVISGVGGSSPVWYFDTPEGERTFSVKAARACNDGALIREWATAGMGIALKSIWDIATDLNSGRLVTVLDEFKPNYRSSDKKVDTDLYVVYQERKYMPERTRVFIEYLKAYFDDFVIHPSVALQSSVLEYPVKNSQGASTETI